MQISRVALVADPEHRRADQQVAHGAAADPGDDREEDEGDERLLLLRREQGAGNGEHRDPDIIEQDQRVGEDGGGCHVRARIARTQ